MKKAFYKVNRNSYITTDKAYGFKVGENNSILYSNKKEYFSYVAMSLTKEIDNDLYIPTWLVIDDKDLFQHVDSDNVVMIEVKTVKKTDEQKKKALNDKIMKVALNFFNQEMPEKFIVIWENEKHTKWADIRDICDLEWTIEDEEDYTIIEGDFKNE
jgi:hypothetical protein